MICLNCGKENEETNEFCEECGAKLVVEDVPQEEPVQETEEIVEEVELEEVACENCEEENEKCTCGCSDEEVEEKCTCGCNDEETEEECCCGCHDAQEEAEECCCGSKKKKILKLALLIGLPFVAIIVAVAVLFSMGIFQSPAVKAVNKFYDALALGDGAAVYQLTTDAHELKSFIGSGQFASEEEIKALYVEQYKQIGNMLKEQFGENIDVVSEIEEVEAYSKKEVELVAKHLEADLNYAPGALQKMVKIESKQTIVGSLGESTQEAEDIVALVDGTWYYGGAGDIMGVEEMEAFLGDN